ncbi:uncharacterized protein LOC108675095 [Hyalella azteca]|uniref:Uncharacterized protein LOC108675095 n=1 Tax=Hyalella azteca TaxID=294128 RepID=A0A8B7NXN0_HYAAZ|nr:uncharacterized protein LOC108675095 [Hyalella azteca]
MVREENVVFRIPFLTRKFSVKNFLFVRLLFPKKTMASCSSRQSYRAVSTENLLAPPEEAFAPLLPKPRIVMGDSGDSGDSFLGPSGGGQYLNLSHEPPGGTRSVPDIEMHATRMHASSSSAGGSRGHRNVMGHVRCSCSHLPRAPSKESIRSVQNNEVLVVAPSSYRDRIIRQHSQPETCMHCHAPKPSGSLRYLPRFDHHTAPLAEGFAAIAADSLRINGALRHFKQVLSYSGDDASDAARSAGGTIDGVGVQLSEAFK